MAEPITPEAKWEKVTEGTYRLSVPGGWLYSVNNPEDNSSNVVFVPFTNSLLGK